MPGCQGGAHGKREIGSIRGKLPDRFAEPIVKLDWRVRHPHAKAIDADHLMTKIELQLEKRALDRNGAIECDEALDRPLHPAEHLGRSPVEGGEAAELAGLPAQIFDDLRNETGQPHALRQTARDDERSRSSR